MLQTSFLSSEREKINCLGIVSCYCKLLCCQSSNIVNWPLMNLAQHCLAAVLSQTSYCVLFFGVSLTLTLSLRRVFPGPLSWPHTTNSGSVIKHCAPCTSLYTLQGMLKCRRNSAHSYILVSKGRICVFLFVVRDLVLKAQKHRLKKTGTGSETASRANTSPGLQVETIPD